jgi:RES domain-containing protein
MGLTKHAWIESQERGWDAPNRHVCAVCFEDEYLKSVIENEAIENRCDYCGREDDAGTPIAAPLSAVLEPIAQALFANFEEPGAAGLPRDTGEWIGEERITDTDDALLSLPLECESDLFEDIARSFHNDAWYPCAKGFWLHLPAHVELAYSWKSFVGHVKHHSRYFFAADEEQERMQADRDYGPIALLNKIGRLSESLGLVRTVPARTNLFRVRKAPRDGTYTTFQDLGPPPHQFATAGRMNPAGISYFYLALEERTALAETLDNPPTRVILAAFVLKVDIRVLDLTHLPPIPSVFDNDEYENREAILFLDGFIDAVSEPTKKDGREHIDYVPSQVVSEYFAQVFNLGEKDGNLDGILYPSAVMPSGKNLVLFPPRDHRPQSSDLVTLESVKAIEVANWDRLFLLLDYPRAS